MLNAQAKRIFYHIHDGELSEIDTNEIKFPVVLDSIRIGFTIQQNINQLREKSYFAANLDSIVFENDSLANVYLYFGRRIKFGMLTWDGVNPKILANPLLRNIKLEGSLANQETFQLYSKTILAEMDESGYPLAKILVQDKVISNDSLFAKIRLVPGPIIYFGGFDNPNDSIVSPEFLSRFLDIKAGDIFKMSKINDIASQVNQLSYMRLKNKPEVKILGEKAYVNVPLKSRAASRFDFLIGVLPNVENETQFTISGEITADFKNKLKRGEEFYAHFRQLKPETQRIDFKATYPYLLNLPFGVLGSFSLYRNAIESRDLNADLGIQYRSGKFLETRFFANYQSSRLIEIDTIAILNTRMLPASLDVRLNNIGAIINYDKRDYRLNPRKGIHNDLSIKAGIKNILPNSVITSLKSATNDFSAAYDTLDLSVFQLSVNNIFEYYIPIKKSSTILLSNNLGIKWSEAQVFFNEYYRIGGSGLLRGFDEESIRAQYYDIITAEYRYLLGLNSYFSVFADYGFLYNELRTTKKLDQPFGFGIGLRFETRAGIFGIDVATGRQLGNALDFRNAKTHFGFVSLF